MTLNTIMVAPAEFGRCACPKCIRLDRRFPDGGYQLALFPYVVSLPPHASSNVHVLFRLSTRGSR